MTATLDGMISDLGGAVLDAAGAAPVELRRIAADLPIEFGLTRSAEGPTLAARPPDATQTRDLATPVGRFVLTLDIARGGDHG